MKRSSICLILGLFATFSAIASPERIIAQRALEYASAWATQRDEPSWKATVIPEYLHPLASDSGLPSRYPTFLPKIDISRGTFLVTKMEVGRVLSGNSPWVLDGKETVYGVEIIYTAVAQAEERVILYPSPQKKSQFVLMAFDKSDNKWKLLDSYPYMAYFYEIPYFLKSWEKILGKGAVKNIPEVRQRLLNLVKN